MAKTTSPWEGYLGNVMKEYVPPTEYAPSYMYSKEGATGRAVAVPEGYSRKRADEYTAPAGMPSDVAAIMARGGPRTYADQQVINAWGAQIAAQPPSEANIYNNPSELAGTVPAQQQGQVGIPLHRTDVGNAIAGWLYDDGTIKWNDKSTRNKDGSWAETPDEQKSIIESQLTKLANTPQPQWEGQEGYDYNLGGYLEGYNYNDRNAIRSAMQVRQFDPYAGSGQTEMQGIISSIKGLGYDEGLQKQNIEAQYGELATQLGKQMTSEAVKYGEGGLGGLTTGGYLQKTGEQYGKLGVAKIQSLADLNKWLTDFNLQKQTALAGIVGGEEDRSLREKQFAEQVKQSGISNALQQKYFDSSQQDLLFKQDMLKQQFDQDVKTQGWNQALQQKYYDLQVMTTKNSIAQAQKEYELQLKNYEETRANVKKQQEEWWKPFLGNLAGIAIGSYVGGYAGAAGAAATAVAPKAAAAAPSTTNLPTAGVGGAISPTGANLNVNSYKTSQYTNPYSYAYGSSLYNPYGY